MILRRSRETSDVPDVAEGPEPSPPEPVWRSRLDDVRAVLRDQDAPAWADRRLDEVERSLLAAEDDRRRLTAAIDRLDPERATRELKDALRAGPDDGPRVQALRRRHEMLHDLLDRRDALDGRIDAAVVDLELLAARSLTMTTGDAEAEIGDHLERLRIDILALEQAHQELGSL